LQYVDIGIAEAKRLIRAGVSAVDEEELPDAARRGREDPRGMDPRSRLRLEGGPPSRGVGWGEFLPGSGR
jgi:hypothetical protein